MTAPPEAGSGVGGYLFQGHAMWHPFDFSIDELDNLGVELFAIDSPKPLGDAMEALATDCGNTLSTVLCDCVNTLSTLFCLSCEGCSG